MSTNITNDCLLKILNELHALCALSKSKHPDVIIDFIITCSGLGLKIPPIKFSLYLVIISLNQFPVVFFIDSPVFTYKQ